MKRHHCFSAIIATVLVVPSSVFAAPVYYEGFDLGVGDWAETNGTDVTVSFESTGLSFGALVTTGGALKITKPTSGEAKVGDTVGTADPIGATRPGSYWVSFLMQVPAGQGNGDAFWTSDGAWDKAAAGVQGGNNIRYVNGAASSVDVSDGNTHLVVLEIDRANVAADNTDDAANPDTSNMWIDPADLSSLGAPTLTFSGNENDRVRPVSDEAGLLKINANGDAGAMYLFDEIRIGATARDVLPIIPEPVSVGLVASLLSLSLSVRRSKQ